MARAKHPQQPIVSDRLRVRRFKANKIICFLFDSGLLDLNHIQRLPFPDEDRRQLAQLLGYSVQGYGDLSYVSRAAWQEATKDEPE